MRLPTLLGLVWSASILGAGANPTGGVVVNGSAGIAGQGTSSVLINQGSDRAVINWQSFSIGSGEMTKFVQPSSTSAALNRVLGGQMSIINGTLSANGQVFLLNGNGIVVGPGGVINTAGFTGSTRDITDSDFMSGNLHFIGGSDGGVKNLGTISALGGDVVLIGKTVENSGTIKATGTAALVAGDDVLLAQKNSDGSTVTVNPVSSPSAAKSKVGVKNTGLIEASSAELKAANGNIYALAIQNDGMVQATTVTQQGGHIYLTTDAGTIVNSGTLDASAVAADGTGGTVLLKSTAGKVIHSGSILARGGAGGTGGNAEISAPTVDFTGTVDLRATGGKTGNLLLDPTYLTVVSGTGGSVTSDDDNGDEINGTGSTIGNLTVDAALNNTNLTLNADNGITVNAEIDWTSGNTLTLSTNHTGSTIAINAPISGPSGSLTLDTFGPNDVISTTLGGTIAVNNFYLNSGSWFQLINDGSGNGGDLPQTYVTHVGYEDILPTFTVTGDFEIGSGATFLRADSGNGSTVYFGLEDIFGVQGISGYLGSNFTLNGRDIDGSPTSNWNPTTVNGQTVNQGFVPIGLGTEGGFTGALVNGLISNLNINRPGVNNVGLISVLTSNGALDGNGQLVSGVVNNVELDYASVTGGDNVGALVGDNNGVVTSAYIYDATVTGTSNVGVVAGLQGGGYLNDNGNQIAVTSSTDADSTVAGTSQVGGLVGSSTGEVNSDSVYDATVTGTSYVGGAVGENGGLVDGVSVTGTVTGNTYVGGVAGSNDYVSEGQASILYATFNGTVTYSDTAGESSKIGGIVGENDGLVEYSNTYPGTSDSSTTVMGDYDVGGIAGYNTGLIEDSYNSAQVNGANNDYNTDDAYIGGIVGENSAFQTQENEDSEVFNYVQGNQPNFVQYGTVQTSYNTGTITGSSYVGGLVGANDYADNVVTTAYNVGAVNGGNYTGGLVGDNYGTVEYAYNSGAVTGTDAGTTGALVGYDEDGATTSNAYWDTSTSSVQTPTNSSDDGSAATESRIGTISTTDGSAYSIANNSDSGSGYGFLGSATPESDLTDLINNGVYEIGSAPDGDGSTANTGSAWFILPGDTRPILTMEFTGNVANPHELQLISTDLGGSFYVGQNIDASVVTNPSEVWSSLGFAPIGDSSEVPFSGSFYGNGETISGLYINRPAANGVGLFGWVQGSYSQSYDVEEINFDNASITGNSLVGAAVGINISGVVSYINSNDGTISGESGIGGIAGENNGQMSYVTVTTDGSGSISGTGTGVGGITASNSGQISYAQNASSVSGNSLVGGIAGENLGSIGESSNTGTITGTGTDQQEFGGIAGLNQGIGDEPSASISQTVNLGAVDAPNAAYVGGLVGLNMGNIDDSYAAQGAVTGHDRVGGLVGTNYFGSTLETSYAMNAVSGGEGGPYVGNLVGLNVGTLAHLYWDTDTATATNGVGEDDENSVDVVGYTTAQLTDASNYAQGDQPLLWNFNPQGPNAGIWGINVYQANYQYGNESYQLVTSQVNGGLPVLQWQTPVNVAVETTTGTQNYGYTPGYTVTGSGAASLPTNMPGGVTFSQSGGNQAGDVDQLTVAPTTINTTGYNAEFLNGTVTIVPAPLYIVADSYVVPVGGATPSFGAVYNGLQNGDTPSSLAGLLGFSVPTNATQLAALYSILVSGQSSLNYAIHFIPGTLDVYTPTGAPTLPQAQAQTVLTAQAEDATIQDSFAKDPANGLDPIYYLVIPTEFGLEGDQDGAVDDEKRSTDYAYASSTSGMPAFSRLVLPSTGVVQITNGAVVVGSPQTGQPIFLSNPGGFLPPSVVANFQSVLSPAAATELLALINGQ